MWAGVKVTSSKDVFSATISRETKDYQDRGVSQEKQAALEEMCVIYSIIIINSNCSWFELVFRVDSSENICVKYSVDDTTFIESYLCGHRAPMEILEILDQGETLGPLDQRWVKLFYSSLS